MRSDNKNQAHHDADITASEIQDVVIVESAEIDEGGRKKLASASAWLLSAGMHFGAVLIMAALVFGHKEDSVEYPPPQMNIIADTPKQPQKEKTAVERQELEIETPQTEDVKNPITQLEEPEEIETKQESDIPDEGNPGTTDAVSTMEMASTAAFTAIGVSSGSQGMFGNRMKGGRERTNARFSSSYTCTTSVNLALQWFKRHQSPNGMWDVDGYQNNCIDVGGKCEPGENQKGNADIACTAYAVMCYLGMGHDHINPGKYKSVVENAVNWLLAQQTTDGLWGERNYEHPIAVMAIAEAYAMTSDPRLRDPAQKGVNIIIARQAPDPNKEYGALGWDYVRPNPSRNDSSVTGWNVMALKSALGAGLQVGSSLENSKVWLERAWKAQNPEWAKLNPYSDKSYFPYTYDAETDTVGKKGDNKDEKGKLACVGAVCAVFLGHHAGDPMLDTLCNYIMEHNFPKKYPTNTYYLYYNTMAIFQSSKAHWEKWEMPVAKLLAESQRTDDSCFKGSWDFAGTGFHGHETGRLLSTAYACLSQEVIWRYELLRDKRQKVQ
jgi:hypothetical protein